MSSLAAFHPAVAEWFREKLGRPTEVQEKAWSAIRRGGHALVAAPTGSGKTLAAFLCLLDDLLRQSLDGVLPDRTLAVYVSPLKALSNDVEKNLQSPLREMSEALFHSRLAQVNIRVSVRTGDTSPAERAAMLRNPPHILITTPESLYLLLTAERGRRMLRGVRTAVIDEIHAMVQDKRGSHLSLSLERLCALADGPVNRIGLSATQRPVEEVARFLTGVDENGQSPPCAVIDTGHRRALDLAVEVPDSPLSAVMAAEVWDEVYARIESLIAAHRTTLIFVNTRRLAERVAHRLAQALGEDKVGAHHGSMSRQRRLGAESRLKAGELSVLVATASLELGIDIGSVDLVVQIGNPKSIAALLQRVGRSGHTVGGTPKGRLFPLTRDELVEAAALLDAVRRGELDRLEIPPKPLDILAQQLAAEAACRECGEEELFRLARRAYPYRDLQRGEFDDVVAMLSRGFSTRRGHRLSLLHHDAVNGRLRGRPGTRLTALTNGGAIPDTFDYDVRLDTDNTLVGSVNEDFAIESLPGDIFLLGNTSWRIVKVEGSTVRVADAQGLPPTIPFWFGEAPGRSREFSGAVSRLREEVCRRLGPPEALQRLLAPAEAGTLVVTEAGTPGHARPGSPAPAENSDAPGEKPDTPSVPAGSAWKRQAMDWLAGEVGLDAEAADQLVDYLAAAYLALEAMPGHETIVLERFFDQAGDMHMVVHAPFGSRMNRAWGLALRKRFCRKFNFELQAAATEDGIILSLGVTHSFPLAEAAGYLRSGTVRGLLEQALLDAPMFNVRWRWNASRALAVQRNRGGKRVPPALQRMAAEDLVAQVFPDQIACFENIQGERRIPDHPLVGQTIGDCLHEAMDIDLLEAVLRDIEAGRIRVVARDLREPSPLAQEILSARPYAFLDDAPLEERRTRAVQARRFLDPREASALGRLDPEALEAVRAEAWPQARTADELHDALLLCGFLTDAEIERGDESVSWKAHLDCLAPSRRAAALRLPGGSVLWLAAERLSQFLSLFPEAEWLAKPLLPEKLLRPVPPDEALREILRGRLEALGPVPARRLWETVELPPAGVRAALAALEAEGFALRGSFIPGVEEEQWCERRLLARIHRYTLNRLRREIEPVTAADYLRFLLGWHGLDSQEKPSGPEALEAALRRLEACEAPAAAWEREILPLRLQDYDPAWLDLQCLSGRVIWGRLRPRAPQPEKVARGGPVKNTPIAFLFRDSLTHWLDRMPSEAEDCSSPAAQVLECLSRRGASFFDDILRVTRLLPTRAEEALAELVSLGLVTSDSFRGLRALLVPARLRAARDSRRRMFLRAHGLERAGRWSLLRPGAAEAGEGAGAAAAAGITAGARPSPGGPSGKDASRTIPYRPDAARMNGHRHDTTRPAAPGDAFPALEAAARTLLNRYGVLFRRLADRESLAPPWRDLVRVLRTLEARGEIRGGRFVDGMYGEQYAMPEAVALLRQVRKAEKSGKIITLCAADPANLQGILTPGRRIPALRKNRVLYQDGLPVAAIEGGRLFYLEEAAGRDLTILPHPGGRG